MRSDNILSADILDLIFENRNKKYGAYQLRKHYGSRLARAVMIVVGSAVVVFVVIKLIPQKQMRIYTVADPFYGELLPEVIADIPKPKPIPATTPPPARRATTQWVSQVSVVPDDVEATTLSENIDTAAIGTVSQTGMGTTGILDGGIGNNIPGPASQPGQTTEAVDVEIPRLTADVMPSYPGGMEALRKFLQRNLQNPDEMEPGTLVPVKIRFVVGYDGKLKSFETIEDGGERFNNEVIRVLKKMPDWVPGKANGEKVSVYFTIPVKFTSAE